MLRLLQIENLAIIERLSVGFGTGLVVFSGETGAGKSIVLSALSSLLGERARSDQIRTGCDRAIVEAQFDTGTEPRIGETLAAWNIPAEEDGTLVVAREISREGKNRCFVNGRLTVLGCLKALGDHLVDIHGQHDHQQLMHPRHHIAMLDLFGDEGYRRLRQEVVEDIAALRELNRRLSATEQSERERRLELANLEFQLGEIDEAGLATGEGVALARELKRLSSAEALRQQAQSARQVLAGGAEDGGEADVLCILHGLEPPLAEIASLADEAGPAHEQLVSATCILEEVSAFLRDFSETVDIDPARQAEVEDRLGTIHRLSRKYGHDCAAILAYRDGIADRIESLRASEGDAEADRQRLAVIESRLEKKAAALTARRKALAAPFAAQIEGQLADLAMEDAAVEVSVEAVTGSEDGYAADGADRVELRLASNPGETARPLARIASGGELSRVALAVKCSLARKEKVPIMVFDEVDAGIGGLVATTVGEKLQQVSDCAQCIVITHSAQIASRASTHLGVEKVTEGGRRKVRVRLLEGEARVEELARMLGGASAGSFERAKELLASAAAEEGEQGKAGRKAKAKGKGKGKAKGKRKSRPRA